MNNQYSFKHTIQARPNTKDQLLIDVLDGLLSRYLDRVPDASKVVKLIQDRGDSIINDHIAFRSIYIESILTIFLHLGFEVRMDHETNKPFDFKSKKLTAVWLKHPNINVPRIFVSQYRFDEGSAQLQGIVAKYLNSWQDPINDVNLNSAEEINNYLHTAQWPTPTYKDYVSLQKESEYVSWVLYNKYYLNHFTLSVHNLASFNFENELNIVISNYHESYKKQPVEAVLDDAVKMMKRKYKKHFFEFNEFLKSQEFNMNPVGDGVMNISPDECLLQSSTRSNIISAEFDESIHNIPGSYVEFAYRGFTDDAIKKWVQSNRRITELNQNDRRDGFELQNANIIFQSTYVGKETDNINTISSYEKSCEKIKNFIDNFKSS